MKKIAPVYFGVTDNRSRVAEGNFCHGRLQEKKNEIAKKPGKDNPQRGVELA